MGMMYSDLLTVPDVARQFAVDDRTVRGWVERGLLKAHWIGRQWLIDAQDAAAFMMPRRGAPKKIKMANAT